MVIKDEILKRNLDLSASCKSYEVKHLYAFGSSTTNEFNELTSNIDLLVEIDNPNPIERGEKLLAL